MGMRRGGQSVWRRSDRFTSLFFALFLLPSSRLTILLSISKDRERAIEYAEMMKKER
jgi:hypothetical protein